MNLFEYSLLLFGTLFILSRINRQTRYFKRWVFDVYDYMGIWNGRVSVTSKTESEAREKAKSISPRDSSEEPSLVKCEIKSHATSLLTYLIKGKIEYDELEYLWDEREQWFGNDGIDCCRSLI